MALSSAEIVLIENLIAGALKLITMAKDAAAGNIPTPQQIIDEQALTTQLISAAHAQVLADQKA